MSFLIFQTDDSTGLIILAKLFCSDAWKPVGKGAILLQTPGKGGQKRMMHLEDKGILLCLLVVCQLYDLPGDIWVPELFGIVGASALCSYLEEKRYVNGIVLAFLLLSFWKQEMLVFWPLLLYDCRKSFAPPFSWCGALPFVFLAAREMSLSTFLTILLGFLAVLLEKRTTEIKEGRRRLHVVEDTDQEKELLMEQENRELLKRQEYEVRLATLTERNRIAREIHDNVGHLLTRSFLQVGAMEILYRQKKDLLGALEGVKASLSEAMDQMRQSVHDLHEEAVDLPLQLEHLIREFTFCPVTLHCRITEEMPVALKYSFLAVIKEGLSNIARHSNATEAFITLIEHPALYKLTISDNGTQIPKGEPKGMGLISIQERVEGMGGIFRLKENDGFGFFISIPKEGKAL